MRWTIEEEKELFKIYIKYRDDLKKDKEGFVRMQKACNTSANIKHDWKASKMRIQNMIALDESINMKGLTNYSKQTKDIVTLKI